MVGFNPFQSCNICKKYNYMVKAIVSFSWKCAGSLYESAPSLVSIGDDMKMPPEVAVFAWNN